LVSLVRLLSFLNVWHRPYLSLKKVVLVDIKKREKKKWVEDFPTFWWQFQATCGNQVTTI
jgi:hypothetical protein